jgi:glutamate/tyrosine decarboxylase-like PLP-dependent enzyme
MAIAVKQSSLSLRGEMDCFRLRSLSFGGQVVASLLAMAALGKKGARAALGGQVEAARALERGVGSLLFSADVNSVTSDAE